MPVFLADVARMHAGVSRLTCSIARAYAGVYGGAYAGLRAVTFSVGGRPPINLQVFFISVCRSSVICLEESNVKI